MTEVWGAGLFEERADLDRCIELYETSGLDGITVSDSQSLRLECWTIAAAVAIKSETLKIATLTTNPVTRHPVVSAAAAATIQELSGGRFTLGIGRGDSPLAHVGVGPMPLRPFCRCLEILQRYLRGEGVSFDALEEFTIPGLPSAAELGYARLPDASRLGWLRSESAKVPLDVSASGPKVIASVAPIVDSLTFALGSQPEIIAEGISTARKARAEAGVDPGTLKVGILVNVVAHPDREIARELVQGTLAVTARWISGSRAELKRVATAYDMTTHGRPQARPAALLQPDEVDSLAVVGTPDECIERLRDLAALGLDRIVTLPRLHGLQSPQAREATRLLLSEVLPEVR
jgi:5,10-methylenetetrahydromethanopterin reductase